MLRSCCADFIWLNFSWGFQEGPPPNPDPPKLTPPKCCETIPKFQTPMEVSRPYPRNVTAMFHRCTDATLNFNEKIQVVSR